MAVPDDITPITNKFRAIEFGWADGRYARLLKIEPLINNMRTFLDTEMDLHPKLREDAEE